VQRLRARGAVFPALWRRYVITLSTQSFCLHLEHAQFCTGAMKQQ
jgi:hypothetical protein